MKCKFKYSILCVLVCFICLGGYTGTRADEISDLKDDISKNEDKYKDIQDKLDELNAAEENLQIYMKKLNEAYSVIEAAIEELDKQIENKNQELQKTTEQIALLNEDIKDQYENMKLRIQYMYESNTMSYLDAFLSSGNIAEVMERMEYISSIMEYDKKQMDKYQVSLAQVEQIGINLEREKIELTALLAEQQSQKDNLDKVMTEATKNIALHKEQIADAEAAADAIEAEIEAQKNTVEKLKAEEERRKQELLNGTNNVNKIPYQQLDGDIKRMAAIIWCEARGESYEGQVAVGTVVMNRVESPRFPNTIEGVISQKGQFSPYRSGKYAIALSMTNMQQSCIDAAIEVIEKGTRSGNWLFFRMKNGIINGDFIGNHVFY